MEWFGGGFEERNWLFVAISNASSVVAGVCIVVVGSVQGVLGHPGRSLVGGGEEAGQAINQAP